MMGWERTRRRLGPTGTFEGRDARGTCRSWATRRGGTPLAG